MFIKVPNQNLNFLVIVILYNREIDESETINSLIRCKNVFHEKDYIVVWDNSPNAQDSFKLNRIKELFKNFHYKHSGINQPLPVVYNSIIHSFDKDVDYVNIWDQDSTFSIDYYESFLNSFKNLDEIQIFVPKVFNGKTLESPGFFFHFKGKKISKGKCFGIQSIKNKVAIMSGIIISYDMFFSVEFDERLRLYGVDTKFFKDAGRLVDKFFVMDYSLNHDLSIYDTNENVKKKIYRFKDFCYSTLVICSKNLNLFILFGFVFLLYKSVQNIFRFKDFRFFYSFIEGVVDWYKISYQRKA
ncbi:glycosyltransferase [Marinilabilia salmonicolor]|uniref:GT2 family glycosyltransferase n=1 Tax=Marinilabilia salmonicolor TaxID=989 RepID=A0A368UMJ2_9BACT|nr:glycosyltransferase [Marinilabilia salmonicolor]RCW30038.1 GT2 family glycosyltransferase [Marinilabilia salmonicolor]